MSNSGSYNRNLKRKISTKKIVRIARGSTKEYAKELHVYREVSIKDSIGASIGLSSLVSYIELSAQKEFGYSFGQAKTDRVAVTLNGDSCRRWKIIITEEYRTGKVHLSNNNVKFEFLDGYDIDAINLCE